jgi:anti-sigma factor RsiW
VDHRRTKPLLATYALGATPAEERPAIEAHLAACPACRTQLSEFQDVAAQLVEGPSRGADQDEALERSWHEVRRQLHTGNR